MADALRFHIDFNSDALPEDAFRVLGFEGEEAISRPYRFDLNLVSEEPDLDLDAALGQTAHLHMGHAGEEPRPIHGILAGIGQGAPRPDGLYYYRAVLVPRLWLLSLSLQNQIYQEKNVAEIVEEEMKGAEERGPAVSAAAGLGGDDFEFRLSRELPKREYVVQYRESDLDFISRLLEHEGVFYYFEQGEDRERIIFCDDNIHLPPLAGVRRVPFRPPSGLATFSEEAVQDLRCWKRRLPARLILRDYNYRRPQTPLQSETEVDPGGHGVIAEYGDHFKLPEEGDALARIRAQELLCTKNVFEGAGDCADFTAGYPFDLSEHYRADYDGEYLVTSIRHRGAEAGMGVAEAGAAVELSYRNEFTAIRSDVAYRPPRAIQRPRLDGVMHGHVDAAGSGERAEIDDMGRYKVVVPFDLSGAAAGEASRWIRMMQPYGGSEEGMHFPLHKGTEVLWTCVNGDPDRPIIAGTVPNPVDRSVVTSANHTANVIRTASGIHMEFNDGPGNPQQDRQGTQQQGQRTTAAAKDESAGRAGVRRRNTA